MEEKQFQHRQHLTILGLKVSTKVLAVYILKERVDLLLAGPMSRIPLTHANGAKLHTALALHLVVLPLLIEFFAARTSSPFPKAEPIVVFATALMSHQIALLAVCLSAFAALRLSF